MSIKDNIKNLQRQLDLKRRFPQYFSTHTKVLINVAFVFIIALIAINYVLDGNSFVSIQYSCHSANGQDCINPFYDCSNKAYSLNSTYLRLIDDKCNMASIDPNIKKRICELGLCDKETVPNGFHAGRDDFFSHYSLVLGFATLLVAFTINHILYLRKRKSL